MASMTTTSIGFGLDLPIPHKRAIEEVTAALKEQDFGVLTTTDVRATLALPAVVTRSIARFGKGSLSGA